MNGFAKLALCSAGVAALTCVGTVVYYESPAGRGCASCHEMRGTFQLWSESSHRNVPCTRCHGDSWTADVSFHWNNMKRVANHVRGALPERLQVGQRDVFSMVERCRACHQAEFAQWRAGPHSATYRKIFLDESHNHKRLLMDDCLRCHGMHFQGGLRELIEPIDTRGPWRLKDAFMVDQPTIPCLTCHAIHRAGQPLPVYPLQLRPAKRQEILRPSLGLFDRRAQMPVAASWLSLPPVYRSGKLVKMSPDPRQALCYQCHSPQAGFEAGSGDDRTPAGVHEGLSCLACHGKHSQQSRASCANCHPRLSNCGLDVETMDTTFKSRDSKHNVHWVGCPDCHPKGVPKKPGSRRAGFQ